MDLNIKYISNLLEFFFPQFTVLDNQTGRSDVVY